MDTRPDTSTALRAVLDAARAPVEDRPMRGELAALAEFRAAVGSNAPRRNPMLVKLATAGAVAALSLTGAAAAAATGLPDQASSTARTVLEGLGITPGAHAVTGPPNGAPGQTRSTPTATAAPTGSDEAASAAKPTSEPTAHGHGQAVSELATTTTLTGRDKGAAISDLASDGKSQAGDEHGRPAQGPRPTPTPAPGGHGDDASDAGADNGAAASGGASTAGAGNATTHRPPRP
jgi:hypothetical protein